MVGLADSVMVPVPVPVLEAVVELLPVLLSVAATEAVAEGQAVGWRAMARAPALPMPAQTLRWWAMCCATTSAPLSSAAPALAQWWPAMWTLTSEKDKD